MNKLLKIIRDHFEKDYLFIEKTSYSSSSYILSDEQEKILNFIMRGNNTFFTGSAGTGKSFIIKGKYYLFIIEIVKQFKHKYNNDFNNQVFVTSTTGISASNIDGMTIHSYCGIGTGEDDLEILIENIRKKKFIKERIQNTKVLIIDEISMMNAELLDKIEMIFRRIKRWKKEKEELLKENLKYNFNIEEENSFKQQEKDKLEEPFGGIQIIISGDLFQLPPINKKKDIETKFCFEAKCWKYIKMNSFELTKSFRQTDNLFFNTLNNIRLGNIVKLI